MGVYPNPVPSSPSISMFLTPPLQPTPSSYPIPPRQDIFLPFFFFFIQFPYHLSCLSSTYNILSFLHFPSSLAPSLIDQLYSTLSLPHPIPLHSLPTKFLSLRGWDEGVLNLKSLVRTLTGTGHSRCCSHQAGHSSAQAGTSLVLRKRGGRKGWGRLVYGVKNNPPCSNRKNKYIFFCIKSMECDNQRRRLAGRKLMAYGEHI